MMRSEKPSLQIAEDNVDHGQMSLALLGVSIDGQGFVLVTKQRQVFVANPAVSSDGGTHGDVLFYETTKLLGTAPGGQWVGQHLQFRGDARDDLQPQPSGIDQLLGRDAAFVAGLPLSRAFFGVLAGADLDGSHHGNLMMDTAALAARLAADVAFVNLDRVFSANSVAARSNHAGPQFVQDLEGRAIGLDAKLALKLECRHARGLRGHKVGTPEPRRKWGVAVLHHGASRQACVALTRSAAQYHRHRLAGADAVRLAAFPTRGAHETVGPFEGFQVSRTGRVIREHALKLGKAGREVSRVHVSDGSRRNQLCQATI